MKIKGFLSLFLLISCYVNAHEKWVNCIGNQSCNLIDLYTPSSLQDLCSYIQYHASKGNTIRAIGQGYSISEIGCTNGCLLSLKKLNRVLSINIQDETIRVEAGITIQDLNEKLAQHNLALSNQAAIAEISLGGALSTGVHGTGHTGSLCSFVKEYELITADGNLHKINLSSDPESFAALSVSFGSLGVIYAVTLKCEPLFYLKRIQEETDINEIIENYRKIHSSKEYVQFFWNPETGKVLIDAWNRCHSLDSEGMPVYKALTWYKIDKNDRDLFSEIAVPLDLFPKAIQTLQTFIQAHAEMEAKWVDINIRFVEKDHHAYLSPSTDGQMAYFAFCILEEDKHLELYKKLEDLLCQFHGRPHWGKLHFLNKEKVSLLYGRNLEKFIHVKKQLDPQEIFSNDFTNRIFKD